MSSKEGGNFSSGEMQKERVKRKEAREEGKDESCVKIAFAFCILLCIGRGKTVIKDELTFELALH